MSNPKRLAQHARTHTHTHTHTILCTINWSNNALPVTAGSVYRAKSNQTFQWNFSRIQNAVLQKGSVFTCYSNNNPIPIISVTDHGRYRNVPTDNATYINI